MSNKLLSVKQVQGFQQRLHECNTALDKSKYLAFYVQDTQYGYVRLSAAEVLRKYCSEYFDVENKKQGRVYLSDRFQNFKDRTQAVNEAMLILRDKGIVTGWRNEQYSVLGGFYKAPIFHIERSAASLFGVKQYGVHINGYTTIDNQIKLWVAKRSSQKSTWPGKLDHIVAGGQPQGISPIDNVIKECQEEASINREIAQNAKSVGYVSCEAEDGKYGLKRDTLFTFDLKLPSDFHPKPQDGEVDQFYLLELDKVAEIISQTQDFKPNCVPVILDFLVRQGHFSADSQGYLDVISLFRTSAP